MLGCQDFCGYYDWTFRYVVRRFGRDAVRDLWAQAIGDESQAHYASAGRERGLRGLYETWTRTGQDEHCDWTFTLDEERNVLRWDMRECPSKGYLLEHDLNACEDYCDHCMGWMVPLLDKIGVEVAAHEHNHCGQCWGEMKIKGVASETLKLDRDIRNDPRWDEGFIERWRGGIKLPVLPELPGPKDPCEVITHSFAAVDRLILCEKTDIRLDSPIGPGAAAVIMDDATYSAGAPVDPQAVLIGNSPANLTALAQRFNAAPEPSRPLLLHAYFPHVQPLPFPAYSLPRPVPVLPLLIRAGQYRHDPGHAAPSPRELMMTPARALGKPCDLQLR